MKRSTLALLLVLLPRQDVAALLDQWRSDDLARRDRATAEALARWKDWGDADLAALDKAAAGADQELASRAGDAVQRIRIRRAVGERVLKGIPTLEADILADHPARFQAVVAAAKLRAAGEISDAELLHVVHLAKQRGWGKVAMPEEEEYVRRVYTQATTLWLENRKAEAAALCRGLLLSAPHTAYLGEKGRTRKTRLEMAAGWIKEVEAAAPKGELPLKLESLFPGAWSLAPSGGRWEVTYLFDRAGILEDFSREEVGVGTPGAVEVKDSRLRAEGSLVFCWNGVLRGDMTARYLVTATQARNLGFVVHGRGGFAKGTGYVAWLGFASERSKAAGAHPILRLPWSDETAKTATVGADVGIWALEKDGVYAVKIVRSGKVLEVSVNERVVAKGEDDGFHAGRPGLAVFGSSIVVESATFTGEFDPEWLAAAKAAGKKPEK